MDDKYSKAQNGRNLNSCGYHRLCENDVSFAVWLQPTVRYKVRTMGFSP